MQKCQRPFYVGNNTLTTVPENQPCDFMLVKGDKKLIASVGRMINYVADAPITVESHQTIIQAVACFEKDEKRLQKDV